MLLEKHLCVTVLDHIPNNVWKTLDRPEMVDEPDLSCYVFARVHEEPIFAAGENFEAGTCVIAPYDKLRPFLLERKVELLM
jgi:hypothetical protein